MSILEIGISEVKKPTYLLIMKLFFKKGYILNNHQTIFYEMAKVIVPNQPQGMEISWVFGYLARGRQEWLNEVLK